MTAKSYDVAGGRSELVFENVDFASGRRLESDGWILVAMETLRRNGKTLFGV